MVNYTIQIKTDGQSQSQPIPHTIDVTTPNLENNPDRLFDAAFREELRATLQHKTSCSINDINLEKIVRTWLEDIREGYRLTNLVLDLPPLEFEKIHQLQDDGDRSVPPLFPPDFSNIAPQGGALPSLTFN